MCGARLKCIRFETSNKWTSMEIWYLKKKIWCWVVKPLLFNKWKNNGEWLNIAYTTIGGAMLYCCY
jgi:hypothetical protein